MQKSELILTILIWTAVVVTAFLMYKLASREQSEQAMKTSSESPKQP